MLLAGRCARADPAALFDAALVRPSRKTFDAALAAFADVTFDFAMTLLTSCLSDEMASTVADRAVEQHPVITTT
ncbi:MAG TPA: hypothetical protein VKP11_10725 [Frankiaceae bacterium]|nr:hypothetical protein [Frankiaceae bacterium]